MRQRHPLRLLVAGGPALLEADLLYRVTSEANIADPISRADCTLAFRLNWMQADTPLDRSLEILAWAADDLEYAVHGAAHDLSTL